MKIQAAFVNFKYDTDAVELAHAWDEFCVDSNPEGFQKSLTEAIASYGDDIEQVVYADIEVPMGDIYARFEPASIRTTPAQPRPLAREGDRAARHEED